MSGNQELSEQTKALGEFNMGKWVFVEIGTTPPTSRLVFETGAMREHSTLPPANAIVVTGGFWGTFGSFNELRVDLVVSPMDSLHMDKGRVEDPDRLAKLETHILNQGVVYERTNDQHNGAPKFILYPDRKQ